MSRRILLAEDDKQASELMLRSLSAANFIVDCFNNGADADEQLRLTSYDLLILDWELPGLSGIEICRQFRSRGGGSPVLFLTGRRELDDKELGFSVGADDYLTKPFSSRELMMRVEALLRRPALKAQDKLCANRLEMFPQQHKVLYYGSEVRLSRQEFALLEFLMRHPGEVFDAETLLSRVWPSGSDAGKQTVLNYISKLRQKLSLEGRDSEIETLHGLGYRLRNS
ncbi:MAG: response regulator transcription factor [Candidatus Obscuribacterales bacterium]|nr:response regulator transcription factor [Candidatus Obscuribacterales bacterium]